MYTVGSQLVLPDCKQLPDDVQAGDCVHIGLHTAAKVHFNTRMLHLFSTFPLHTYMYIQPGH